MRHRFALKLVAALFLLCLGTALFWRNLGLPQYSGSISSTGIQNKTSISFDNSGVPHIAAKSEHDAFFALGYIMASERLFQMDLSRRLAKGELSELFGSKTIEVDKLFRTLGLGFHFKKKFEKGLPIGPHIKAMRSFYEGVNSFIEVGPKPREYYLLGSNPKPFSIHDGYAIVGYMAYTFAMGLKTDLLYDEIKKNVGVDALNQLRIRPSGNTKRTVSSPSVFKESSSFSIAQNWIEDNLSFFTGSNAWVLSPKRSSSGGAILANDPHVRLNSPGLWYEAHMKWGEKEVYGHFVPGLPFAALGHNRQQAWGVTISYVDDMDFYQEYRKDNQVFVDASWVDLEKRVEKIVVKGEASFDLTVEVGPHGPLLNGLTRLASKPGKSVSLKWSHFNPRNEPAKAFYGMMMASSRKAFKEALSLGTSPGLNVLYADKEGNIGRYLYGGYPLRPAHMIGDVIYPGDDPEYSVTEELDFYQRPHIENPESGVIVSANQRIEAPGDSIRGYFQPNDRYTSIHEILKGKEKWSLEELKFVQTSNVNIFSNPFKDRFIRALGNAELNKNEKIALEILKGWDGVSQKNSQGSLVYHQLFFELERDLLPENLKPFYQRICSLTSFWHRTKRLILKEEISQVIVESFKKAVANLLAKFGKPSSWKWGDAHKIEFVHPLGRASKALASVFNFGPYPLDGGFNHINNLRRLGCSKEFNVQVGPSTRRLIDMSRPALSYGILPMGNSSHLYGPFYDDQFAGFSNGKYRKQLLEPAPQDISSQLVLEK